MSDDMDGLGNKKITRLISTEGMTRIYEVADGTQEVRHGGSVSWRNNNPGNLKFEYANSSDKTVHSHRTEEQALFSAQSQYAGIIGLDQWGNAVFESYDAGRVAQIELIKNRWGEKSVDEMLGQYSRADYSGATHHKSQLETVIAEARKEGVDLEGKQIKSMTDKELNALADGVSKAEGWSNPAEPKTVTPPSHVATLKLGVHGASVSALQADLAALGYTDNRGKPLQPDDHYGRNTEAAVMAFQSDHGLHSDGVAGKNTFDALQGQRQLFSGTPALAPELPGNLHPRIDRIDPSNRAPAQRDARAPAPALPDVVPPLINPYADPRHPNHGLYAELRERIPNASENRIVECTAACHMAGIRSGELGQIHLRGKDALVFAPNGGAGGRAEVALTSPAPPIQQTMQHVQGFEQNQQMAIAQMHAQQQQTGPVMGGPRMG